MRIGHDHDHESIRDLHLIERECKRNTQSDQSRFSEIYEALTSECKKYRTQRQEYLSYILIKKFGDLKDDMISGEKTRVSREIKQLEGVSQNSTQDSVPSNPGQNENHFNQVYKVKRRQLRIQI